MPAIDDDILVIIVVAGGVVFLGVIFVIICAKCCCAKPKKDKVSDSTASRAVELGALEAPPQSAVPTAVAPNEPPYHNQHHQPPPSPQRNDSVQVNSINSNATS
eukprot:GILI01019950.1.p1 GENE.GILI01019950.1~~GILI01019950.1.p1  ORF type:complete len:104 (+),score=21.62 GILI01019950.1:37-348(+)